MRGTSGLPPGALGAASPLPGDSRGASARVTRRRVWGLLAPLRGRILLAVVAGSGAAVSTIGLIAASGLLISRAALRPARAMTRSSTFSTRITSAAGSPSVAPSGRAWMELASRASVPGTSRARSS